MAQPLLTGSELAALVDRVFSRQPHERALAILVDLPDAGWPDHEAWRARRAMAADWRDALAAETAYGVGVRLFQYRNVGTNNGDLPPAAWLCPAGERPADAADDLAGFPTVDFEAIFRSHPLVLAPTELSATAPLKLQAPKYGFRAATLPGFLPEMVPALRLDYGEVDARVRRLAGLLDAAAGAAVSFEVDGRGLDLFLDLRFRKAHVSGGLIPTPGTAGNLPSGEAYIVPYEGEVAGEPSRTAGKMPVELDGEVVVYDITANRAVAVEPGGEVAGREAALLHAEPAYGNLAELGLGVLADFGVEPVGAVLLDEKLGLHIAFGRSDHFGGQVGTAQFSSPRAVVHLDRVYLPAIQPQVQVLAVDLIDAEGRAQPLMRDGRYVISFAR
jgi:hypothetical protein